jgi:uncharacterized DUF497 family protein
MDMDFEWDDAKAALNLRKHGMAFEDAAYVFLDSGRIDMVDDRDDYGEERWLSIGWVNPVLLVVAHTERGINGDVIRIISARKANAQERAFYHEAQT